MVFTFIAEGQCCNPLCLNKMNKVYEWDKMECTFLGFQCYQKEACRDEGMCVNDHGIKDNLVRVYTSTPVLIASSVHSATSCLLWSHVGRC